MAGRYQQLSTVIDDGATGLSAQFTVYPLAPEILMNEAYARPTWVPLARHLAPDFVDIFGVSAENHRAEDNELWIAALAATFLDDAPSAKAFWDAEIPAAVWDFASYLCTEPLLPFRRSPISGQAIANLLTGANGAGAGAIIGTHLGWEHGLLVVFTVPGGMIVGGAAMGVATALEKGLHERILSIVAGSKADEHEPQADAEEET